MANIEAPIRIPLTVDKDGKIYFDRSMPWVEFFRQTSSQNMIESDLEKLIAAISVPIDNSQQIEELESRIASLKSLLADKEDAESVNYPPAYEPEEITGNEPIVEDNETTQNCDCCNAYEEIMTELESLRNNQDSYLWDSTPDASTTQRGLVNIDAQGFAGDKTFIGTTKLGDGASHYSQFDTTGHQTMIGNAQPWEDLRIEPVARTTGANAPTFEKWIDNGAGSRGVFLYSFDDAVSGSEKELHYSKQLPHAWNSGDIDIHVHWIGNVDDTTAAPRWGLEYSWSNLGEVFPNTTIIYTDGVNYVDGGTDANITAKKHYISKFATLSPSASQNKISSIKIGRLFRDSADAADTYNAATNKCGLLYVDTHIQYNSIGSTDEYTK